VGKVLYDTFKAAINALTIEEVGTTRIEDQIRLRDTRPFRTENRPFLYATKSVFNKVVAEPGAGGFELTFALFLEKAPDVKSFAKNYLAVSFKIDYVKPNGDLSNYTPDFIVRTTDDIVWIIETKGQEEIDLPKKMARLKQYCEDATEASVAEGGPMYRFIYVDQKSFEKHTPTTLAALASGFTEYQA
jgi:type III restriction enzyme